MRTLALLALCAATSSSFLTTPQHQAIISNDQSRLEPEKYLCDLGAGDIRWVTEDEKWELKRNGHNFMDITTDPSLNSNSLSVFSRTPTSYPKNTSYSAIVKPMAKELKKENMRENLEVFTAFHTRYYRSSYGIDSAKWLLGRVSEIIEESGADEYGAKVEKFAHPWGQFSIIARFPGKSNKTVVIGAHQDSINLFLPSILAAPGADDDGSGTVTILEAMRVLLQSEDFIKGKAENTVEFQWYSAEEAGLLGSQAIFKAYSEQGRDVKAMLQQDMTGYVERTLKAGEPESVGVITDFVDPDLTEFIKEVITVYCGIPYVLTKCGYACSDHASASKYGYPSAFVIESDFKYSDTKIHTTDDKIEYLSFSHMLQHAKMTLGLAYELAFAKLN